MNETARAARIRDYWLALGYDVNVTLRTVKGEEYRSGHKAETIPGVRSDMVNGLPRGYQDLKNNQIGVRAA